jgi:hypothetical protein
VEVDGRTGPRVLPFAPDAADDLQAWRERVADLEDAAAGLFLSWLDKLPGMAVRLALVLELLWWCADAMGGREPESVSRDALRAALRLLEGYALPMARRAFGEAALPQADRDAVALARWLRAREPMPATVNARDLRHADALPTRKPARYDRALAELDAAGWVRPAPRQPGRARTGMSTPSCGHCAHDPAAAHPSGDRRRARCRARIARNPRNPASGGNGHFGSGVGPSSAGAAAPPAPGRALVELRPYQERDIARLRAAMGSSRRVLYAAPTGSGKQRADRPGVGRAGARQLRGDDARGDGRPPGGALEGVAVSGPNHARGPLGHERNEIDEERGARPPSSGSSISWRGRPAAFEAALASSAANGAGPRGRGAAGATPYFVVDLRASNRGPRRTGWADLAELVTRLRGRAVREAWALPERGARPDP